MHLLEFAITSCLAYFYELTDNYVISLILLSLAVSACLAPFYYLTGILESKERAIKQRLEPFIQKINTIRDSKIRHSQLSELYKSFSYYPFYALRSLASLFIQIPILVAAYNALGNYAPLKGTWLGYPDRFLNGFNIWPFLMTLINLCSVFISSRPNSKERQQGIFIAMIFLGFLYTSPAALLIYWTFNQLFNLIRYLMVYPFPKIKKFNPLNFDFIWQFMLVLTIHCILCIFIEKGVYGILVAFPILLIYKFIKKKKIYFSASKFKNNIVLNLSVMAFPAILIFKSNSSYFEGTDLLIYALVLFLFSVLLSLFLNPKFSVSFILSLMFLPLVREATFYINDLWISFFVLFIVVFIFISSVIKQKGAIVAFSLIASAWLLVFAGEVNLGAKSGESKVQIPEDLAKLELSDSASIYLFMHDAFPHKDYAEYFNLPYDSLMNDLEENGFKIYDVYSMGNSTLTAMSSVFGMRTDFLSKYDNVTTAAAAYDDNSKDPKFIKGPHLYYFRNLVGGNNLTNLLLQKNNYKTSLLKPHPYEITFSRGYEYYDFIYYDEENTVKVKNRVLRNILSGTLNSNLIQGSLAAHMISMAKYIKNSNNAGKIFMWGTGCPGHSTLGGLETTEKEMERFIPLYNECLDSMKREIDIIKEDSNAIIIFMGDHGGYFIDDGVKFPKNYDFNKTNYMKFRDIFGAFMAVRWPNKEKAEKYDSDFDVSQNLFPIVFAYLSDSEIPLKYKVQNTELRLGSHKFDKGVFYKDFYKGESK